jgi:hypothetical protein
MIERSPDKIVIGAIGPSVAERRMRVAWIGGNLAQHRKHTSCSLTAMCE